MQMSTKIAYGLGYKIRVLFDKCAYTGKHGLCKGLKRRGGFGFLPEWLCRSIIPTTKEHEFLKIYSDYLKGAVVYDVGVWEGVTTIFFAAATTASGEVIAFEPNPWNIVKANDNIELNGFRHVLVFPFAIGQTASVETMHVPILHGSWSSLTQSTIPSSACGKIREVRVPVLSLDRASSIFHLQQPDFVKLDVEGLELNALLGARELLAEVRPDFHIEIHAGTSMSKKENTLAILRIFREYEYRVYDIERESSIELHEEHFGPLGHIFATTDNSMFQELRVKYENN